MNYIRTYTLSSCLQGTDHTTPLLTTCNKPTVYYNLIIKYCNHKHMYYVQDAQFLQSTALLTEAVYSHRKFSFTNYLNSVIFTVIVKIWQFTF